MNPTTTHLSTIHLSIYPFIHPLIHSCQHLLIPIQYLAPCLHDKASFIENLLPGSLQCSEYLCEVRTISPMSFHTDEPASKSQCWVWSPVPWCPSQCPVLILQSKPAPCMQLLRAEFFQTLSWLHSGCEGLRLCLNGCLYRGLYGLCCRDVISEHSLCKAVSFGVHISAEPLTSFVNSWKLNFLIWKLGIQWNLLVELCMWRIKHL